MTAQVQSDSMDDRLRALWSGLTVEQKRRFIAIMERIVARRNKEVAPC